MKTFYFYFLAIIASCILSSCTITQPVMQHFDIAHTTTKLKNVVCKDTIRPVVIRFEGEKLPEVYQKVATIKTAAPASVPDEMHLNYLLYEANRVCANEIILVRKNEIEYAQERQDDLRTSIDESRMAPQTIRRTNYNAIAIYNPATSSTSYEQTNYYHAVNENEQLRATYFSELNTRSTANSFLGGVALGVGFVLYIIFSSVEEDAEFE